MNAWPRLLLCGATLTASLTAVFAASSELATPFRVECGGSPIDTEVGHAAPLFADFDGDKVPDLLVGQFGGGKLRIHRNEGTAAAPRFRSFAWFQAGGQVASVPFG